jgi:hypothetical protein
MGPSLQPFKYAMAILPRKIDSESIGIEPDADQPSMSLTIGTTFSPYSPMDSIIV